MHPRKRNHIKAKRRAAAPPEEVKKEAPPKKAEKKVKQTKLKDDK
tara:strand:- start:149 stop:283 length:135 start_codon:yes stop_codon:yes gene_type:complete